MAMPVRHCREAGFTLVEAIMVIAITGVVAGMVALFLRSPIDSYFDSVRRAELTDMADTAVRLMTREIRFALPNSVRNAGDGSTACVEFMPTKAGGRYRAKVDDAGNGDPLDFHGSVPDPGFDMYWLNSGLTEPIKKDDIIVIYNDGTAKGNAYTGVNAIMVASAPTENATAKTTSIAFVDTATGSPFQRKVLKDEPEMPRFQVVRGDEHVVAYACTGVGVSSGTGTGTLVRYSRTLSAPWAPATCADMAAGATLATVMENVSACTLKYEPPGSATGLSRHGMLVIALEIRQADEPIRIYHQVHVDNTP